MQRQYRGTSNSFLCGFLLGLLLVIGKKSSSFLFSNMFVLLDSAQTIRLNIALAIAYKPQSYPFVCSATFGKMTFSLFACVATKLATRTSSHAADHCMSSHRL